MYYNKVPNPKCNIQGGQKAQSSKGHPSKSRKDMAYYCITTFDTFL